MKDKVFTELDRLYDEMVRLRRDFHMYPELSFQEERSSRIIADYQKELGLDVITGVGGNGVVATLQGRKPGKTVAIRADVDAIAIEEEKEVPYKSCHLGDMHACGHDAHTSIDLGISIDITTVKNA